MIIIVLLCLFTLQLFAVDDPVVLSETNRLIISNEVLKKGWSRTAVMATPDNRPIEPTGQVVALSDAAALGASAEHAGEIGDAAKEAMRVAIQSLASITNQIADSAQHIAISIPSMGTPNLQSMVISEGQEGSNDWQIIRFNQLLQVAPSRTIEYTYPGGTATVECTWDYPWNPASAEHRCTFPRPPFLVGNMVMRSRRQDLFGGVKGLSFGAALVTVDGVQTFTGSVTNNITGQILTFDNGVLK